MKNLLLIFFIGVILWSCDSSNRPEVVESSYPIFSKRDTTTYQIILSQEDTIRSLSAELDISENLNTDTIQGEYLSDTIHINKRPLGLSPLDTSSVLPELRKNYERITLQQKMLDSIIKK
jgi:hypothetical protein